MQRWIFSNITPVFSVTWSFRNDSNILIWCLINTDILKEKMFCFVYYSNPPDPVAIIFPSHLKESQDLPLKNKNVKWTLNISEIDRHFLFRMIFALYRVLSGISYAPRCLQFLPRNDNILCPDVPTNLNASTCKTSI